MATEDSDQKARTPLVRDYTDSALLVAGGTAGIGLATAIGFAEAGVRRIALLGRDQTRGETARTTVLDRVPDTDVVYVPCDAHDPKSVQTAVDDVHRRLGGLDIAVTSVTGAYVPELLHRIPLERVPYGFTTQALPPMLVTKAVLPLMSEQGGGSIINVASDAAKIATPGESVIGAAMAAIVMFSRVAAIEAKRHGVRVNTVTPSLVAGTEGTENIMREGFSKDLFERAAKLADLGVVEPEDLASLIVFLGGPSAARLTGQAISVNGGISAA
jgi:2-hydroxycyclohexanecarboxyl-CoA dehydrogenase